MLTAVGWKDSSFTLGKRPHGTSHQQSSMAHVPRSVAVHVTNSTTTPNYSLSFSSSTIYEAPRQPHGHVSAQQPRVAALTTASVMEHTASTSGWTSSDRKADNYRILPNTYVPDAFVYERSIDGRSDTLTSYSSSSAEAEYHSAIAGSSSGARASSSRRESSKSSMLAITNHSHNTSPTSSSSTRTPTATSNPHPAPTAPASYHSQPCALIEPSQRDDQASDGDGGALQLYRPAASRAGSYTATHSGGNAIARGGSPPMHDGTAMDTRPRTSSVPSMQAGSSRSGSNSPPDRSGRSVDVRRERSSSGSSSSTASGHDRAQHRDESKHTASSHDGARDSAVPVSSVPLTSRPPLAGRRESNIIINTSSGAPITSRTVRFSENLICPSPVPPSRRRKGWYNKRGDQLWTNDGQYLPPEPDQANPPDLNDYPDYGVGWMNEEGIRIDMQHRLIPKPPLRPALKRSGTTGSSAGAKSSADGRVAFAAGSVQQL